MVGNHLFRYRTGMFGGKFLPFHQGHELCLSVACRECMTVFCIMFTEGSDERKADVPMQIEKGRIGFFMTAVSRYPNAIPVIINVGDCRNPDGTEDWDAETPLVRRVVGDRLDAVYSSEPSYGEYFKRAYPEAVHRLVDPDRLTVPVSGTAIRKMCREGDMRWRTFI